MIISLFTIVIQFFFCFSVSSQTASSNRFKRIDYEYDLVSGKVNKVSYQKDSADQFIHQYSYDSDNRITKVETSSDNVVWDVDAKYFYYAHGPLARTEIGNDKVQGIDYAYTLQGWIKGVNSNTLDKKRDMGQDGKDTSIYDPSNPQLHANFAQDAFGYSLNYFKGDYKAISQVRWNNTTNRFEAVTTGSDLMASRHDLHNGNISSMVTTIVKPTITPGDTMQFVLLPQGTAYKYDQLNRLVEMKAWQNLNSVNNTWGTGLTYNGMYNNKFSYDANGNILTQLRKDANGTAINDLSYNRYNLAGKTMQNRLYMVDDAIGNTAFTDDIDDQGTFDNSTYNNVTTNNNYGYDEIGNMNRNNQKEIAQIKYTVYGKVKEVIRTSGSSKKNLKFDYDPSGNRIAKHVYNSSNVWEKTEYYVLDAQGNTMSVYKHEATGGTPPISFAQIEKNIYGSSRIGVEKTHKELIGAFASTSLTHVTGNKQYDGVNHLGNVLVSFTDKRLPIDADNNSVIDGYWPEVVSANDYYPFGIKMKERSFASANNRYQFNNKQYDDETETSDFGARILDADLGVWNAIDDRFSKFPAESPYIYVGDNPTIYFDFNGEDKVYFNCEGVEIKRVTSKTEFATYVQTGVKTTMINGKAQMKATFEEAKMPGVITGYEDPKYQKNDYQIAAETHLFNRDLAKKENLPTIADNYSLEGDIPDKIDVNLVKAMIIQESGSGANGKGPNGTGETDIMQVNNKGDWAAIKSRVGLTKGQIMTPASSVKAGLKLLYLKGMTSDGKDQDPDWKVEKFNQKWNGKTTDWFNAVKKYNGGGVKNYDTEVKEKYESVKEAKPENY